MSRYFFRHNLPILNPNDPLRLGGDIGIMGHHDDSDALFTVQALKDLHHLGAGFGVEIASRLIGQQDGRLLRQGARNRDPLLLPA